MINLLLAGATGAALAYFLDPNQGRRRRNVTRDRVTALVRRGSRQLTRTGRYAAGQAYGVSQQLTHRTAQEPMAPNDETLVRRVESEVFRDPNIPKGQININAEDGVIVLRGQVDRPDLIQAVESAVRKVAGVRDVENLLHLPGTPPRMS